LAPLALVLDELRGTPDHFTARAAAARLPGAISAVQTLATSEDMRASVAHLQAAQTSLQVLGDWIAAPAIWQEAFAAALRIADRDGVIPALERLIAKTSATPFQAWDPLDFSEADDALAQLGDVEGLEAARAAVERGKQAIAAFAGDPRQTLDEAIAHLDAAQVKLSECTTS
jgi:hypothetical protein